MTFDKYIPMLTGFLGVVVGASSILLTGWIESEKKNAAQTTQALVQFAEFSWGTGSEEDWIAFTRKLSGLTVFVDQSILEAFGDYTISGCNEVAVVSYDCASRWADVVNAMRVSVGQSAVNNDIIIKAVYGKLDSK